MRHPKALNRAVLAAMRDPRCKCPANFTQLLTDWRDGNPQALERLTPLVYEELRRLARNYMRAERGSHTLQATAVVHEAFMRLIQGNVALQDRAHFFALASRLMRRVLVDHAKSRGRLKRGVPRETLTKDTGPQGGRTSTSSALDDALESLAANGAASRASDRALLLRRPDLRSNRRRERRFGRDGSPRHSACPRMAAARNRRTSAVMIPRARWQQIQSLFDQFVDAPPAEQAARLASACGGDGELCVRSNPCWHRTERPRTR